LIYRKAYFGGKTEKDLNSLSITFIVVVSLALILGIAVLVVIWLFGR